MHTNQKRVRVSFCVQIVKETLLDLPPLSVDFFLQISLANLSTKFYDFLKFRKALHGPDHLERLNNLRALRD